VLFHPVSWPRGTDGSAGTEPSGFQEAIKSVAYFSTMTQVPSQSGGGGELMNAEQRSM